MTKQILLDKILSSISEEEWQAITNHNIIASEFNYTNLAELKLLLEKKDQALDKNTAQTLIDNNKVVDLEEALKNYLGQYMADKPEGWKWIILGCLYNVFMMERPMHPIDALDIKVLVKEDGATEYFCPAKELKSDSTCRFCPCRKMSNYEITKRKVQKDFAKYNHEEIANKLGLKIDDKYLYIRFVDRDYTVNRISGEIYSGNLEADFNQVLTIYDLLCYSKPDARPSGQYLMLPQLSRVQNASSYAGEGFFTETEKLLDGREAELEQACIAMGGIKYGKGDVSYLLPFYDDLKLVISFWSSDDEFPAQLQYMFDKNSLDYMHYETCWYALGYITDRIKKYLNIEIKTRD